MLPREMLLKELELWPIWTLRQPLPTQQQAAIAAEIAPTDAIPSQTLQTYMSEDGRCAFVLANAALSPDEKRLFANIQAAMRMRFKSHAELTETASWVQAHRPQIVIAMGENVAQYLLQSTALLAALRGHQHVFFDTQLVASFDLKHLLQHAADKVYAWQDFCLVLQWLHEVKAK